MSAATSTLGIVAVGIGGGLVYAAVTGQSPLDELRKALTSGELDGRPESAAIAVAATPAAVFVDGVSSPSAGSIGTAANLVPIGQGSHRLDAAAAAAFAQAQRLYGRSIPITDSYRSPEVQAAGAASDPSRFATANTSAHVEGRAIDINLPALGLSVGADPSTWTKNAAYKKLYAALSLAGWCNYQINNGTANGRTPEPWHYSWGTCK